MKTINKIISLHNSSYEELEKLEIEGKVNGCGGEGGVSFDNYIKNSIALFNNFKKEEVPELYRDLRIICLLHDRSFHFKKGFYLSNYRMARDIFLITNWAGFFTRLSFSLGIFIILNKFGKEFYK